MKPISCRVGCTHAFTIYIFFHQMLYHFQGELDELEREEFFRLKKVQAKKKRDSALQDAEVLHCTMRLILKLPPICCSQQCRCT